MTAAAGGISVSAWGPDGRVVATGGYDDLLVLWDAEKRDALWALPTGHEHVRAIAFSADGARIATGGKKDGRIRVWERATGRALGADLVGHTKEVWGLAFAADGKTLVSTGLDGTIRTWDAHTGAAMRTIQSGLANGPRQLVLHPKQPIAAVGNHDSIAFWNIETGAPVAGTLKGLRAAHGMSGLAFNEDGERLMSADSAGGVALIDWRKGEIVARGAAEHRDIVLQTAFSGKGDLIATACKDGVLGLWRATVQRDAPGFSISEIRKRPHPYAGAVTIYSNDGRYIVHMGFKHVTLVDHDTQETVFNDAAGPPGYIAAFTPDNKWFTYVGAGQRTYVLNIPAKRRVELRNAPPSFSRALALSPNGSRVAVGMHEHVGDSVVLADTGTGQVLGRYAFAAHRNRSRVVTDLTFSPDGKLLLAATESGDVARLEVATMRPAGNLWEGLGQKVVFSPDGSRVAAMRRAGHGNTHAVIVDSATGVPMTSPMSPRSADSVITSLAFTPDGRFLLNAAGDRVVMLWDAATGERLGRQQLQYEHAMRNIRLTADARRVYATSGEGKDYSPFLLMEWDIAIDPVRLARTQPTANGRAQLETAAGEVIARLESFEPNDAAFVPGSEQLAVATDSMLRFMSGSELRDTDASFVYRDEGQSEPALIHHVAVSRNGRRASAAADGAAMQVFDVATGKRVSVVANSGYGPKNFVSRGHGPHVFLADGRLALTWEHGVRIVNPEKGTTSGKREYPLESHPTTIAAGNWSPLYAIGAHNGTVLLADANRDTPPVIIERAHPGQVVAIAFSPNDHLIATGGVDGNVRLFDAQNGRAIGGPWRAHALAVTAVTFSADGQFVASGSTDGTLRVWSVRTGEPVSHALTGHTAPVFTIRQEQEEQWLSFARDGTLRRWRIAADECAALNASEAVVMGNIVNLRDRPEAEGNLLRELPFGTRLRIVDRQRDCATTAGRAGRWVRVEVQDDDAVREGWLFDAFLSQASPVAR